MTFLHPWFLAGLAGVLVPLLIHLLARRRVRRLPFSSVVFLAAIRRTAIRWARVTARWLLALRIALVAVTALALARPSCDPHDAALTMVVLDGSASMGAARGAVWHTAQETAIRLVATCPDPAAAGVARGNLQVHSAPSRTRLAGFLRELSPQGVALDVERILEDAAAYSRSAGSPVRLVLVSDFQQDEWRDSLAMPSGVELWGVPIAGAQGNLWLGTVSISGAIRADGMIEIDGVVGRSGAAGDSCNVTLDTGGVPHHLSVGLDAEETHFSFRLPRPPGELLHASIVIDDQHGHTFDDRREAARWSADRCRVAILGPDDQTRTRMAAALDPDGTGRWGFEVRVLSCDDDAADSADVLVVLNASRPGGCAEAARSLRARGMVLIADAEPLTEEGAALFQRVVGAAPLGVRSAAGPAALLDEHPVLEPFKRLPPRGFSPPRVDRFWSWGGEGIAILRLGDDPLLVESTRGPERALVFLTGMEPPWSDWASRASFVPLVQLVVDYASGSLTPRPVQFAAPFLADVSWRGEGPASLRFPDGSAQEVVPEETHAGVARIRLGPFFDPGLYSLWKSGQVVALFEPVAPLEERTTAIAARPGIVSRWIEEVPPRWPPTRRDPGTLLLLGALALLVGETWLGFSFSRGASTDGPEGPRGAMTANGGSR